MKISDTFPYVRIVRNLFLISLSTILNYSASAQQATIVYLENNIGNVALMQTMQSNATLFLSEVNQAYFEKRVPYLSTNNFSTDAISNIKSLWATSPFKCDSISMKGKILKQPNGGYQVRSIPVFFQDAAEKDRQKEGVIVFNDFGRIDNFYIAIELNSYLKILDSSKSDTDLARKMIILDFLENFRTGYNRKDTAFLQMVFSDDALIITGRVVKVQSKGDQFNSQMSNEQISYQVLTKQDYLKKLKHVFGKNEFINVQFDSIRVMQSYENANFYGVALKQNWNSSTYSDVGYVFLLIDFRDMEHPLIHIRSWQPEKFKGKMFDRKQLFGLQDFQLPQ